MARKPRRQEYFRCPCCDAAVPVGAKQCPECYNDEETGWSETEPDHEVLERQVERKVDQLVEEQRKGK